MALIVPACQPGWEEMENLRGNLRKFEITQNEVSLGGSPTKVTRNTDMTGKNINATMRMKMQTLK